MLAVIHHLGSSRLPCPVALLTARPRRAARCRFQRFVTVRNSTRRARRTTGGGEHAHLRTRKGRGPLARRKVLSLALSLTAALTRPVLALAQASDQAPPKPENVLPPDQPFERLIERNARYMSGVARRHGFPPSATLSSADKSFRRNLELCRFAHCARVSFRLFARRPLRLPGRLQLRQRRQSRELRIRRGGAKVPAPAGSPALGLRRDQGDDVVGPGWGGAPRPFAFAGRRAGTGGHRRTRRFAGEGNTRNRPPKRRVPEDRNADSQRPVDGGRLKVIGEIYRLATGQMELIG